MIKWLREPCGFQRDIGTVSPYYFLFFCPKLVNTVRLNENKIAETPCLLPHN